METNFRPFGNCPPRLPTDRAAFDATEAGAHKYLQVFMTNSDSSYISTTELARRLGVHRTTIVRWIKAGIIPAERFGPKTIRVPEKLLDLQRSIFLDRQHVPCVAAEQQPLQK